MEHGGAAVDADLFGLLYVSTLAVPDGGAVERICAQSRINNERDGVSGLLVFDGHRFCQFVEGSPAAITDLRRRIEADPRHVEIKVLKFGPQPPQRRFPSWRLGFAYSADPAAIARLGATHDDAALAAFEQWLPSVVAQG